MAETGDVSLVMVMDGTGRLLMGRRRDNGRWTLPGGHLNDDEDAAQGAKRELLEEAGLVPVSLSFLRTQDIPGGRLHCFSALAYGTPHGRNDPDQECDKWEWVDARGGLPTNVWDELHGPAGDANVVRQAFDLKRAEREWLDAGFADLGAKTTEHETPLQKSEADTLLGHPDPRERAMALKLRSVTPADVSRAVLDPNPWVWRQALEHPFADYALATLANASRDAAGKPLFDRHMEAFNHKRFHPTHLEMMYRATHGDAAAPLDQRVQHLQHLAGHPLFPAGMAHEAADTGLPAPDAVQKSEAAHKAIRSASTVLPGANHDMEQAMPHVKAYEQAWHHHVAGPDATAQGSVPNMNEVMGTYSGITTKAIYHAPVAGHETPQRFMVKPYHDFQNDTAGWAEATSQELYHAAGIGHVHQKSFVAPHGTGDHQVPATVIHIEPAQRLHEVAWPEEIAKHPHLVQQARQVTLMDFLTGQTDRHTGNLMYRPDGNLLAIDNAIAFDYNQKHRFGAYNKGATGLVAGYAHDAPDNEWRDTFKWWDQVGPDVRRVFGERAKGVKDKARRERMIGYFNARADWLDSMAYTDAPPDRWWDTEVWPGDDTLQKKLGGDQVDVEFLHHKDPDVTHVAQQLTTAHPEAHQPHVDHFEQHVNQPATEHLPHSVFPSGLEKKTVYKHGARQYMVKGVRSDMSDHSGWNEMTSQALYHAAGIGHLHQTAHVSQHADESHPDGVAHGLVIHMRPNTWTLNEAEDLVNDTAVDPLRALYNTPEHQAALRKIALMDAVTANPDRHNENLMVDEAGRPMAIDHGLTFDIDHQHTTDGIDDDDAKALIHNWLGDNDAAHYGGLPDDATWAWWDENKSAILKKFHEHTKMFPDRAYRQGMQDSFRRRVGYIDTVLRPHLDERRRTMGRYGLWRGPDS